MITFPDWYLGGWPDQELVVMDLLQPFLDQLTPAVTAVSWLPDDYQLPIVRVYRMGGGADADGLLDAGMVQLGVIGASRADSWAVAEYCRQIMRSYEHGGAVQREDGSTTNVQSITEAIGPQQIPELNPDDRLVPITFQVVIRRPRGVPDYAKTRASL